MHEDQRKNRRVIFCSWQSDLPNATNRGFIHDALELATRAIRIDQSLQIEPVIDRDTRGVPGAPDIASTIFDKIDQADVFVCDISLINQGTSTGPTPNPNVLLELGYAIKALGADRVIMVMNNAFGGPELLPFDLRMRRVVVYTMPHEASERAPKRKKLSGQLDQGLRIILSNLDRPQPGELVQPVSVGEQARIAIQQARPDQKAITRRFMRWLVDELDRVAPDFSQPSERDDMLVQALEQAIPIEQEFLRLVEVIARMDAAEAAFEIYKGFEQILERYDIRQSGNYYESYFDFYKFMGHELFVTFIALLVREGCWNIITQVLDEDLFVPSIQRAETVPTPFRKISEYIALLEIRNRRLDLRRMSLHADLLRQRFTESPFAQAVSFQEFMEADYFLYLRAEVQERGTDVWILWRPWSSLYLKQVPRYLSQATRAKYAEQLVQSLGVDSVETLRTRLVERGGKFRRLFSGAASYGQIDHLDFRTIGTR